ncbi:MAG: glycosyltransferase family 4 protein, partial [Gemmatimonadetes bacterium]|nr:glycosyltransferase family 4 protein [Gemmatimonadota bacterium]
MNLLLINQHYPPDAGATGKVLAELREELAHRGHAVTALTGRPSYREARGTEAPARERRHGVTVERVRVLPRRDGALGRMAHYLSFAVAATWRGLRLERPDAILAFSSTPFFGGLAVRVLAALKRVPYVYVVQDAWPEIAVALGALRPGWRERVARLFEGWTWRGAERVIVIGEELATLAAVRGVAADRVSVIENWADASRIVPQHISRFRRDLGFSDDDFVVEYAGNLGHAQALDTVLEAARVVRETSRAIRFLFVGEGARAATFRRRAELVPGVVCAPFQPEDRLSDVLAAADLGVVPLKSGLARYCVPSKVYSILASGRPVAAAVDADSEVARLIDRA